MYRSVLIGFLFCWITIVSNGQTASEYWNSFSRYYSADIRGGAGQFSSETHLAANSVVEHSHETREIKMVEYLVSKDEKKVKGASDFIAKIKPNELTDSLMLMVAMNATYHQPAQFEVFYRRFSSLYFNSIIPEWYIANMVDYLPEGKWLVTSGQLETFQVKARILSKNKVINILDVNVLNGFNSSKGFRYDAVQSWMKGMPKGSAYVSLLLKTDYYSEVKNNLYVQGLALLYSESPWTDNSVNQRLVYWLQQSMGSKSPYLRNYLPALYVLRAQGVNVSNLIEKIEE